MFEGLSRLLTQCYTRTFGGFEFPGSDKDRKRGESGRQSSTICPDTRSQSDTINTRSSLTPACRSSNMNRRKLTRIHWQLRIKTINVII